MKTSHNFKVGDEIIDRTAEREGWADVCGEILKIDGPHVLVCYESGNERAKLAINLRTADAS